MDEMLAFALSKSFSWVFLPKNARDSNGQAGWTTTHAVHSAMSKVRPATRILDINFYLSYPTDTA